MKLELKGRGNRLTVKERNKLNSEWSCLVLLSAPLYCTQLLPENRKKEINTNSPGRAKLASSLTEGAWLSLSYPIVTPVKQNIVGDCCLTSTFNVIFIKLLSWMSLLWELLGSPIPNNSFWSQLLSSFPLCPSINRHLYCFLQPCHPCFTE